MTVSTLSLIAAALEKPITHFRQWFVYENLEEEELTPTEQELILQFRKIWSDDLKQLAIKQLEEIADISVKQYRRDLRDI